jgi:hypothetical protein
MEESSLMVAAPVAQVAAAIDELGNVIPQPPDGPRLKAIRDRLGQGQREGGNANIKLKLIDKPVG